MRNRPIVLFLLQLVVFSALFVALVLWSGRMDAAGGLYITALMWSPGLAAIVSCIVCGIDLRTLGWGWGKTRFQVLSYLIPAVYSLIAYSIVWITGLGAVPSTVYVRHMAEAVGITALPKGFAFSLMILLNITFGFVRSCPNELGEEIGWRGFLTPPLLQRFGFNWASTIVGFVWAVWHYPLLIFGEYNSGTPVWYSLICFTIMLVSMSHIYTYMRMKSGNLWTATFLHASHNLFIQTFFTPITINTGPTPYVIDEFGFMVPLVTLLFAVYFTWKWRASRVDIIP